LVFNLFASNSTHSRRFWTSTKPPQFDDDDDDDEQEPASPSTPDPRLFPDEQLKGGLEYYIWKAAKRKKVVEKGKQIISKLI